MNKSKSAGIVGRNALKRGKFKFKRRSPIKRKNKLHAKKGGKTRLRASQSVKTPKIWSLKKADTEFRAHMLKVIPNPKCVFPDCPITDPKKLTVSHYHGRAKKGTRFSVKNCDFICRNHHYWDKQLGWEFQKQREEIHGWDGRYTLYMREKLGEDEFILLTQLAESGMKPKIAIQNFQSTLNQM